MREGTISLDSFSATQGLPALGLNDAGDYRIIGVHEGNPGWVHTDPDIIARLQRIEDMLKRLIVSGHHGVPSREEWKKAFPNDAFPQ